MPRKKSGNPSQATASSSNAPVQPVKHPNVDRIVLFFLFQGVHPLAVQQLVQIKCGDNGFDDEPQKEIVGGILAWFNAQNPVWEFNKSSIAKYITRDLTEVEQLHNALKFTDEEVAKVLESVKNAHVHSPKLPREDCDMYKAAQEILEKKSAGQ